jgi:hypothetical protein
MALDALPGGEPGFRWCRACRQEIRHGEPATHVHFQTDPQGTQGLTGAYHQQCSRPFASLARVVNMNPWRGF